MVKLGRLPCIILICVIYASTKSQKHDVELMLSMPKVSPRQSEAYRCTVGKVSVSRGFIVRFEALATQSVAHHILLYGCKTPAFKKDVWDCKDTDLCKGREKILFAWAKNAPPLDLPAGVGFYVGSHTSIKYLVMQVHYAKKFDVGVTDSSAIKIKVVQKRLKYAAGIFDFAAEFANIPPKGIGYHSDVVCRYKNPEVIVPFAYRVHTHSLGRTVSAYRIRGKSWTMIGQGNPQSPQAFYLIKPMDRARIVQGDHLAARCTFDAPNRTKVTTIGPTSHDEMCNFYIMYYTRFYDSLSPMNSQTGCYESTQRKYPFPASSNKVLSLDWYKEKNDDEFYDDSFVREYEEPLADSQTTVENQTDDRTTIHSASIALGLVIVSFAVPSLFILTALIIQKYHSRRISNTVLALDVVDHKRTYKKIKRNYKESGNLLESTDDSDIDSGSTISM